MNKEQDYLMGCPYNLDREGAAWVQKTISEMTLEEKAAQLFIIMNKLTDSEKIRELLEKFPIGGLRYRDMTKEEVIRQNYLFNKHSKIPMLIAANCECGPNEVYKDAAFIATEAQLGATRNVERAFQVGDISGGAGASVGINCTFSPIVDIYVNGKNTIVNSRSYGSDPDRVLEMSKAYICGIHKHNMLCCAKHFPGDGVDERDQHLVMSVNDLDCEDWDNTCGKVYQSLINDGIECIMAGHIALPSYSKKLNPKLSDSDILPASLSKELLTDLLRRQMGFQGLIITDASHMGGLFGAMPRCELVPKAIAAGCDMFLFTHDLEEDIKYMINGIKDGVITEQRLQNALEHILGMKAHLGLHKQSNLKELSAVQTTDEKHKVYVSAKIADESITLVKNVKKYIPVNPEEKSRARLYFITNAPNTRLQKGNLVKEMVVDELTAAGFSIDTNKSFYEMEEKEVTPLNIAEIMKMPSIEQFRNTYDVVFVVIYMHGYSRENSVRLKYSFEHSNEIPWFNCEVPTIGISLNFTNHLYDLPMLKTYINAYAPTRECIHAAVEKIVGKSEFKGCADETVWCDRWDTRV